MLCAADIVAFWESQDPILADAIMHYLWFPITAAFFERTFSLAGLIDANNQHKMSSSLRKAAVGMYCNGDVECRFTEPSAIFVDIKSVVLFCPCSLVKCFVPGAFNFLEIFVKKTVAASHRKSQKITGNHGKSRMDFLNQITDG